MMQSWSGPCEMYGTENASFYGPPQNGGSFYYPEKQCQNYGNQQQFGGVVPVGNSGVPAPFQQQQAYQPYQAPQVNHAYLEQPYQLPNQPPCQGPPGGPWNYGYCYGFYGESPCPYVDVVDMEDFMNNEKRKEKSRDAARCRRSRETEIFQELAGLLPMPQEDVEHLDKASVMRLSIAYLRVRDMLELFPNIGDGKKVTASADAGEQGKDVSEDADQQDSKEALSELMIEQEQIALQTLDGFLLVLSADGDVTYVSENVGEFLGISQIDMMGQPIWDYSHQCDHEELREALNGRHHSPSELVKGVANSDCKPQETRDFFLRLKCTLTSRGRSVNIKSASYKVIHVTGHIACKEDAQRQLVAVARPLPHPSNIEVPLDASTFLSKHSLDMKFSYVDDKMFALLGYNPADLMGKPLYECHHGIDSEHLMGTFKNVISKGQSETARYRFLARTGGYAWVVTQATLIYDKQKPHSIVCVNYVISGVENKDEIYSCAQLEARQQSSTSESAAAAAAAEPAVVPTPESPQKKTTSVVKVLGEIKNRCSSETPEPVPDGGKPAVVVVAVGKENPRPPKPETVTSANNLKPPISSRPVSVTASIFSSAAAVKKDKPPTVNSAGPQSVTAKLFVTLSSPQQAVTAPGGGGGCNKPKHATEKIFAPRTEDMNKGFLMFSEEEPGLTMLKDEPDDLTHLAPTAGDACIPLEETGPFFNDVFDDFMIPESYTSLLQDELNSLDSTEQRLSISVSSVASPITIHGTTISSSAISHQTTSHSSSSASSSSSSSITSPSSCSVASPSSLSSSSSTATSGVSSGGTSSSGIGSGASSSASSSNNGSNSSQSSGASSNDPFINYRDEISEISHSPHLLSPGLSKSPEGSSIPSLCSPNGSGGCPEDELAFMTLNMDDDLDLSMRAPYISMSEVDDLPLLTSDDLMWGAPAPVSIVEGSANAAAAAAANKYLIKDEFSGHQQHTSTSATKSQQQVAVSAVPRPEASLNSNTSSNNHNIENNCNIGNKIIDSSLAALLCGNVINIHTSTIQLQPATQQQQQQNCNRQQQQQILIQQAQDSIIAADVQQQLQQQQREILGDKKISMVHHPMVVISPGFKNSSAVAASTQPPTTTTTTTNTIEAWAMGNELLLNGVSSQNSSTTSSSTTTTSSSSSSSSNKLNVIASIVSKKSTGGSSTKRSLAASESGSDGSSKRVRSGSGAVQQQQQQQSTSNSSPQLLQQLMAPSPVPAKAKAKSKLDQSDRWPTGVSSAAKVEQVSNSVLMNLLVSGCDTNIPKSPPEILIADGDDSCQGITMKRDELSDEEDEQDRIPILQANPMLGSATSATIPLTILTGMPPDSPPALPLHGQSPLPRPSEDFLMTVSPSLLTPSDLELWRAIQQHGLDPNKIPLPAPGCGGDPAASNLLAVLDPAMAISRLRNVEDEEDEDEQDFEMTIPVNEILQNNLI